jgi:inosose dehydratase
VTALLERVAGAPITWGVCEVPGWGVQLDPDRVLEEMVGLGLRATEIGPQGFLPGEPAELRRALERHGLSAVGGFVAAVLHDPDRLDAEVARLGRAADALAACGATELVLAAAAPRDGYDRATSLDDEAWDALVRGVHAAVKTAADRGVQASVHPHMGTAIEGPDDVRRFLQRSDGKLCIDTGHLLVGGADPIDVAREATGRVAHVHLKDASSELAAKVRGGALGYREAVGQGLYRPLGQGDVDVAGLIETLEASGYGGWYVLEQDTVLDDAPAPGSGPVGAAAASLAFIAQVERQLRVSVGTDPRRETIT